MKPFILINDYGGYAFIIELAVKLAERGYRVRHVYTTASGSPTGQMPQHIENLQCINVDMPPVPKDDFIRRRQSERRYGVKAAAIIRQHKPDVVLSANTPLEAQYKMQRTCDHLNIPFIFWLQDVLSVAMQSVLSQKIGAPGRLIGCYYHHLEKKMLRRAQAIIVIADAFAALLKNWRINNKVFIIPNWAPLDRLPVRDKVNAFAREYDLTNKFVVLYAGTMGMKQNPQVVVKAAEELLGRPEIIFVVISDGVGMRYLREKKSEKQLQNLLLLPLQPFERLPDCLGAADVGLVLLDAEAGSYCVPSKVWSIYCAARPVLLVVPPDNPAAQITLQQDAGIVLDPRHADSAASTILTLTRDAERRIAMGRNGRCYAERYFNIDKIADQFEHIIMKAYSH